MLTDFQNSFINRLSSKHVMKGIIKYPTTPEMRRYITLWNVNVGKLLAIKKMYRLTINFNLIYCSQ